MAYSVTLANRVREYLAEIPHITVEEKAMFGGLAGKKMKSPWCKQSLRLASRGVLYSTINNIYKTFFVYKVFYLPLHPI